jgi:hypothetical protein
VGEEVFVNTVLRFSLNGYYAKLLEEIVYLAVRLPE